MDFRAQEGAPIGGNLAFNPNDAMHQIRRRSKSLERNLDGVIRAVSRPIPDPGRHLQVLKMFRDDYGKVSNPRYVSEPDPKSDFGRHGEVVYFIEITKEEALKYVQLIGGSY